MKLSQHIILSEELTTLSDVIRWHRSLVLWHAQLASHFVRPEPFQRMLRFVQGLLSGVERKNGWQLAEQAREATPYDEVGDQRGVAIPSDLSDSFLTVS